MRDVIAVAFLVVSIGLAVAASYEVVYGTTREGIGLLLFACSAVVIARAVARDERLK